MERAAPMEINNFCRRPFTELVIEPNGTLSPCCVIRVGKFKKKNFVETDIEKYLHSPELKEFQAEFLNNERPQACQVCWNKEKAGIPSLRIAQPAKELNRDWKFTEIHLKLDSVCNYKCRICGPYSSSAWLQEERANGMKMESLFNPDGTTQVQHALRNEKVRSDLFERVIPNTKLIRVSGGEPLLSSDGLEFFKELIRRGLNEKHFLVFTNLSQLKFGKIFYPEFWKQFPKLRLIVSCDGSGESVEYSRTGLIWSRFLENLTLVRHRVRNINCVTNIYSVYSIPDLVRHCFELNLEVNIEPVFRDEMDIQMLPIVEKIKIKEYYERFISGPAGQKLPKKIVDQLYSSVITHMFNGDLSQTINPRLFKIRNEELDRRRGTDFGTTFPELKEWYNALAVLPQPPSPNP